MRTTYNYARWRHHCLCLIACLALLSNCIIWAIVAAFYGRMDLVIWLGVGATYFLFMSVLEYRECGHYHARLQREKTTNHTNQ